jgi:hypothetical protein
MDMFIDRLSDRSNCRARNVNKFDKLSGLKARNCKAERQHYSGQKNVSVEKTSVKCWTGAWLEKGRNLKRAHRNAVH